MAEDLNGGSKKKLFVIIALAVVLLAGGGAGAWFMFGGEDTPEQEVAKPQESAAPGAKESAYYVILPQPFIFNVTGDKRDRLVQVKVQLMVRGDENEAATKQHIPLIESTLLQTFSAATVEQLRTPNGRIDLRQQALTAVQDAMIKVAGRQSVERVLFTGFVMQ
ncbi:flagellar basal body-associated protein FliL [Photobacterium ganghwense]|uniref:Flagellar protein FliL n=1 Tax=Photobacterium ganghwense TaxID=320778 RepID=A0A0J1HH99_9GAMM|nr:MULTISPECIES: flagellar basal body-associated protein FliL [Photobacterium]KLV11001.1 flagellar basal body-associated protein FliL [Photobacterium ganghwense]MBV1840663.1 flagellar basal body-associated protein FliL [Photobacterium ganghwense]PSU11262.1 flagellar basal body-associated protein FliL [Photobacterium ganghwense]QSV13380.1 flagellar basal body-associated protein FliL [Photobacterium ganghwense]